jgi:Bacterial dnaA  protein
MANRGNMSPEDFERLLLWLGPDRDLSAKKYTELHAHLSRWFYFQGCRWPEDLADEVWNRIAKKLPSFVTPDKDPAADIPPSDLMTKVAILGKKAEQERVTLPVDVALFIASSIWSNDELEGVLMRLLAHSSLDGAEITLPYAQRVLKNFIDSQTPHTSESIQEATRKNFIDTLARFSKSIQKDSVPILLGYARNVLREYRSEIIRFDEKHDPNEEVARVNDTGVEVRALCLELCLQRLDDDDRQLLREYHRYEQGRKIEHRKAMANARQSTLNAIRLKVSRLMSNLRNCVKGCCRSRGLEVQ